MAGHWESEEDKWIAFTTASEVDRGFKGGDAGCSIHPSGGSGLSFWCHADTFYGDVAGDGSLISHGVVKNSLVHRETASGALTGQTFASGSGPSPAWVGPGTGFTPMDMVFDGTGGTATTNVLAIGWSEPTEFGTPNREGLIMAMNAFTGAGAFTDYSLNNGTFFVHSVYNDASFHYLMGIEFVATTPGGFLDTLGVQRYIRLARAPLGQLTTPANWTYWNGSAWVSGVANATRLVDSFGVQIEGTPDVTKVGADYIMAVMTVSSGAVRLYKAPSMDGPWVLYTVADVSHRAPSGGLDPPVNGAYWRGFPKFHEYLFPDADTLLISHSFGLFKVDPSGPDPAIHISQYTPDFLFLPVPSEPETPGSWHQLLAISREIRAEAEAEAARQPVACPNDGEPLRQGPQGQLYCPFDGWRPGDPAMA